MGLKRPISQRDLSRLADVHQIVAVPDIRRAEQDAVFLSGVWATEVRRVRDEGHTISVILQQDWVRWKAEHHGAMPGREWLIKHEVSIPMRPSVLHWKERAAYLPIAPNEDVSYLWNEDTGVGTGAEWRRH